MNSSRSSSPTLFNAPKPDVTIISEAKRALDIFKSKAEKMTHEKEYEAPSYGSSDKNDRMYYLTHVVSIKKDELKLSEKQFYAVSEMISGVIHDGKIEGDTSADNHIQIDVRQGSDDTFIRADYERQYKQRAIYSSEPLPAPIGKVSFEKMKTALDEWMRFVFATIHDTDGSNLVKSYPNLNLMLKDSGRFTDIERICKELDKEFSLMLNVDFKQSSFSIPIDALNRAQDLLFSDINEILENKTKNQI